MGVMSHQPSLSKLKKKKLKLFAAQKTNCYYFFCYSNRLSYKGKKYKKRSFRLLSALCTHLQYQIFS